VLFLLKLEIILEVRDARAEAEALLSVRLRTIMATGLNKVIDHLQRTLSPPEGSLTDGQLLARFVSTRDEASFTALVRRHGAMVLAVCLRRLRHAQDAEDCFQATFLVLARKAATVLKRESVGSFLYGVAYRIALKAKAMQVHRRAYEQQVREMPHPQVLPVESQDWLPWLDHELNLLPESYRAVIVACDLEGQSRKEVARFLGLPEGTVSSRLARGRRLLAKRLSRYGLALSGSALAIALSEGAVSAVPAPLVSSTVKIALLVVAGELAVVPTSVGILMKGALKTMFLAKLKLVVGAVMVVAALGSTSLAYRATGQSVPAPADKGSGSRPPTELDVLRKEVELLKLKVEVVQEKLRAQEAELRALRPAKQQKAAALTLLEAMQMAQDQHVRMGLARIALDGRTVNLDQEFVRTRTDPLLDAETALKKLREARDAESRRQATDALENALKTLREQSKKPESPRHSP
jgi:RNA polymerase sigma factor (sigma-70 family)